MSLAWLCLWHDCVTLNSTLLLTYLLTNLGGWLWLVPPFVLNICIFCRCSAPFACRPRQRCRRCRVVIAWSVVSVSSKPSSPPSPTTRCHSSASSVERAFSSWARASPTKPPQRSRHQQCCCRRRRRQRLRRSRRDGLPVRCRRELYSLGERLPVRGQRPRGRPWAQGTLMASTRWRARATSDGRRKRHRRRRWDFGTVRLTERATAAAVHIIRSHCVTSTASRTPLFPEPGSPSFSLYRSTLPGAAHRPSGELSRRPLQLPWNQLRRRQTPGTAPRHQV